MARLHDSDLDPKKVAGYLELVGELPLNEIRVRGKRWTYLATGKGNQAILFIRGLGASSDIWWQQIAAFDTAYKIISLNYPSESDPANLVAAVDLILDKQQVKLVHVVGSSYGACIAQWFATSKPDRVLSLVLCNAYLPTLEILGKYHRFFKLMKWLPNWLTVKMFLKLNHKAVMHANEYQAVSTYNARIQHINKKELISIFTSLSKSPQFSTSNLRQIPTLIFHADDDYILESEHQLKLQQCYPWAQTITLKTGGHFLHLTKPHEFNTALLSFMRSVKSPE